MRLLCHGGKQTHILNSAGGVHRWGVSIDVMQRTPYPPFADARNRGIHSPMQHSSDTICCGGKFNHPRSKYRCCIYRYGSIILQHQKNLLKKDTQCARQITFAADIAYVAKGPKGENRKNKDKKKKNRCMRQHFSAAHHRSFHRALFSASFFVYSSLSAMT